jgi:RNA polymerase sigma-70 factor (ECF subfamily)
LREAFDYAYDRIAEVLQVSEENARQLVSRARKHLAEGRRRPVDSAQQRRLLETFLAAAQRGDLQGLEKLLAADVVSFADGGGLIRAAINPVEGRDRVAKYVAGVTPFWHGLTLSFIEANGRPSALLTRDGECAALAYLNASEEGIDQLMWFMRPSKLTGISLSSQRLRFIAEAR